MLWSIYSHSDTVLRIWNAGKSSSDGSMRAPIIDSSWVWLCCHWCQADKWLISQLWCNVTTCKYLGSLVIILTGQHTLGLVGLHKFSLDQFYWKQKLFKLQIRHHHCCYQIWPGDPWLVTEKLRPGGGWAWHLMSTGAAAVTGVWCVIGRTFL